MDNKKIAAATTAVFTYIKTQEEAAYYAASAGAESEVEMPAPAMAMQVERQNKFSAWATAGRLNQMQQNSMMLMKVR